MFDIKISILDASHITMDCELDLNLRPDWHELSQIIHLVLTQFDTQKNRVSRPCGEGATSMEHAFLP